MSVLTTLPNVIKALSSRALGKEDTFDVPAAKALSPLTHSPRRGGSGGEEAGLEQNVSALLWMSSLGTGKTLPPYKVPSQVPARRPSPSLQRRAEAPGRLCY